MPQPSRSQVGTVESNSAHTGCYFLGWGLKIINAEPVPSKVCSRLDTLTHLSEGHGAHSIKFLHIILTHIAGPRSIHPGGTDKQ